MHLLHIIDPRDALDKSSRDEIYLFAQRMGVKEITEEMFRGGYAKERMMKVLRRLGITNIQAPPQQLGQPRGASASQGEPNRPPMSLDQLMDMPPAPVVEPPRDMAAVGKSDATGVSLTDTSLLPMGKLKKLAKERGIKQLRTDNRETLLAKINGKDPA